VPGRWPVKDGPPGASQKGCGGKAGRAGAENAKRAAARAQGAQQQVSVAGGGGENSEVALLK